jgi:hypothetical protein
MIGPKPSIDPYVWAERSSRGLQYVHRVLRVPSASVAHARALSPSKCAVRTVKLHVKGRTRAALACNARGRAGRRARGDRLQITDYSLLQVQTVLPFKQHVFETAKRPFPLVRLGLRI